MILVTARKLMTPSPGWCTPHDPLAVAAQLMVKHDCGAIPVVDDPHNRRPVGMVTDRDIVLRIVVPGRTVVEAQVQDAMSRNPVAVHEEATFAECTRAMRERRIRRLLVVDDRGKVIGIVTDGDLARACACDPNLEHELALLVEAVSGSTQAAPAVCASPVITGHTAELDRPGPCAER